jgi:DNA invertase Pin-like site-specific DNA recombinase
MTTIVDIYCRSATSDEETKTKLEQQEAACHAYCQECGLTVGRVYHEVASGMIYRDRELLRVMRRRYCSGQIQGVVVATLDRLSRSQIHTVILLQEMAAHNVAFYCVHDDISDAYGRIVKLLLDLMAEVECDKALDRSLTD